MALFDSSGSGCGAGSATASTTVGMLIPIWQRVLERPGIGIDDNFFDAGGNVHSADLLFRDIQRECGRELPSSTIFHAPTIASLASLLEQATLPRFSPFIRLKAGSVKPPILMAHGLGGRARFSQLAKHIQTCHPIYGIQAKGIDGREEPFDRIEDMAEFYLGALNQVQQEGPYILIGYSFGGLVALEMAQRLFAMGKNIGLLVLVDAYPHPRYMSAGQRLRLSVQRAGRHVSEMRQRPIKGAISYFISGLKHRMRIAQNHSGSPVPEAPRLSLARTTLQVQKKAYLALARYRPQPYPGKIKFVKSESDSYFPGDPVPVWANLATSLEVETVPGSHLNMVTTHFESLAAILSRYVNEAFSSLPNRTEETVGKS